MRKTVKAWGILTGSLLIRPSVHCTRRLAVFEHYRGTGHLPVDPERDMENTGHSVVRLTINYDDGRKK
jgi:hypothetical protein